MILRFFPNFPLTFGEISGDAFPWGAWPRDAAVDTRK